MHSIKKPEGEKPGGARVGEKKREKMIVSVTFDLRERLPGGGGVPPLHFPERPSGYLKHLGARSHATETASAR